MTIFANFFYYLRAKWNILSIYFNIKYFLFHFLLGFGNIDLSLDPSTCAFFTFFSFSFLVLWSINFLSLSIVLQLPFSFTCPSTSFFLLPVLQLPFSIPCPLTSFFLLPVLQLPFSIPFPLTSFFLLPVLQLLFSLPCPLTSFLLLPVLQLPFSIYLFFLFLIL